MGDAREAWELVRAAESAAPTLAGRRLERLARWLGEEEARERSDRNQQVKALSGR